MPDRHPIRNRGVHAHRARLGRRVLAGGALLLTLLLGAAAASAQAAAGGTDQPGGDATQPHLPALDAEDVPPEVLAEASLLLSGVHGAPDRALLEARVPAAREVLLLIAREPDLLPLQRGQALWALAQWDDDEVVATYEAVADEGDAAVVHDALLLLGQVGGERAVPDLRRHLADPDLQVRLSAIAALGEIDSDSAVAALEEAARTEPNAVAQERLAAALQRVR